MPERILAAAIGAAFAVLSPAWAADDCASDVRRLAAALSSGQPPESASPVAELLRSAEAAAALGNEQACREALSAAQQAGAQAQAQPAPPLAVVTPGDLHGAKVFDSAGQPLGEIEEVVLDPATGRVVYAIVGVGGFLGVGEKSVAIPWAVVKPEKDLRRFVVVIDKAKLANAPSLDRGHYLRMLSDRQVAESIHVYFGADPYWSGRKQQEAATPAAGGAGQTR